jgi:hypothetical protein
MTDTAPSKFDELVQSMQRDFNCLSDSNRATRTGGLDRIKRKLLPFDSKVRDSNTLCPHSALDEWRSVFQLNAWSFLKDMSTEERCGIIIPILDRLFQEHLSPLLLKLFDDSSEACRTSAMDLFLKYIHSRLPSTINLCNLNLEFQSSQYLQAIASIFHAFAVCRQHRRSSDCRASAAGEHRGTQTGTDSAHELSATSTSFFCSKIFSMFAAIFDCIFVQCRARSDARLTTCWPAALTMLSRPPTGRWATHFPISKRYSFNFACAMLVFIYIRLSQECCQTVLLLTSIADCLPIDSGMREFLISKFGSFFSIT